MLYLYTLPKTQSVFILVKHNYNVVKTYANKIKVTIYDITLNFATANLHCL